MNILSLPPDILTRARINIQRARLAQYRAWRRQVENFKTVCGGRPTLVHVPEEVWRGSFVSDTDAVSAVVTQLEVCDD